MRNDALPLFMSNVTPADCLLDMLESIDAKRDFNVWCSDFSAHSGLLSGRDKGNLARLAIDKRRELYRETV